jgi:3-hydroxy-9,10-secoandrosta-1,3,5(10)-triene-9,17-dione monooxygenase
VGLYASGGATTLDELVERARGLAPRLQGRATQAEALRRMPDETMADFVQAGLLRVFVPERYGGYELDYGPVQLALSNVLGRACGSSAWIQSVLACHAWIVGMYPKAAQDAVWTDGPDTIVASAFAPSTGKAQAVEGGYVLDGQWQFSSGVHHAQWLVVMFGAPGPEGLQLHFGLVPRKDFEVLDTWYSPGLRATGSSDVQLNEAFVPHDFSINVSLADGRPTPGSALNHSHIYRLPLWSVFSYNIGCPALGMARCAVEEYIRQTASRPDKELAQGRHARIAESAAEVDAAEALLLADAADITRLGKMGEPIPIETRARWRRDMAYAVMVWTRAVDRLIGSVGAHGMKDDSLIQRAFRDIHAAGNHTGLVWDNHVPVWGRLSVGLDPLNARGLPLPV